VGEKTPSQLGPLERANLNHWTEISCLFSLCACGTQDKTIVLYKLILKIYFKLLFLRFFLISNNNNISATFPWKSKAFIIFVTATRSILLSSLLDRPLTCSESRLLRRPRFSYSSQVSPSSRRSKLPLIILFLSYVLNVFSI
jgi:hypothetical protein